MVRKLEPIIGEWYRDHGEQRLFEVVALDEDDDRINIQYADGDLLALSGDNWRDLLLSMAPAPSDSLSDNGRELGNFADTEHGLPDNDWHDSHDGIDIDDY